MITWSFSTTVRNPERLREFLRVLKLLEHQPFNAENQIKYQVLLIQNRLYKPKNIPLKYVKYFEDMENEIPYKVAKDVFDFQEYRDPPMRGRQSVNPLNKLGFSIARSGQGDINITDLGNKFLSGEYDIGYVFLKSILKLQFPNPWSEDFSSDRGFDVMPLIAALHLIKKVNEKYGTKGLTQTEFSLFIPTLINYRYIDKYVDEIEKYRKANNKDSYVTGFAKWFYATDNPTDDQIGNFYEYGDNTMRYFRLTRYFVITRSGLGAEWRIDIEPTRMTEINQLLEQYSGKAIEFRDVDEYLKYISDISQPALPSDKLENLKKIFEALSVDIKSFVTNNGLMLSEDENSLLNTDVDALDRKETGKIVGRLRNLNIVLKKRNKKNALKDNIEELERIITIFRNPRSIRELLPEEFEKIVSDALLILDDEINIRANFPVDDNGEPISHAPGNKPDIECFYKSFNAICEVTLNTSSMQWVVETQPVMRHLREFEREHSANLSYCIFIAPRIHGDTLYHFWVSITNGYNGTDKQRIIPFSIENFTLLLETMVILLKKHKRFGHEDVRALYESILSKTRDVAGYMEWFSTFPAVISEWQRRQIAK